MEPHEAWNTAYHQLELQIDRASFDTWLRPAVFLGYAGGVFTIGVHNAYACDMLQRRLYRNIRRVVSDVYGETVDLRFELQRNDAAEDDVVKDEMPLFRLLAQEQRRQQSDETAPAPLASAIRPPTVPALPECELNPRFRFERFITNSSSQIVHEAALAVADYPATVYNPFLIYGDVGLGKTHLLQAIAHRCAERGQRVVYVPSEAFTNDLVNAIRTRTTAMFREKYRSVDVLLVDDIQFISGKETTQEEFFHTFNALVNFNKQIVLASDRHPSELKTLEDRLKSRFQGGLVADIQPLELEARVAILRMWSEEQNVALSDDVLEMVARRAPNNVRELEGMFNQIVIQSRLNGSVSLPRAQVTLTNYSGPRTRGVTIERVIEVVAARYNLEQADLVSRRRTSRINRARQVAMYLSRSLTDASLPQIGRCFGDRSHTTVLHGCNKIEEEIEHDAGLAARVDHLRRAVLTGRST